MGFHAAMSLPTTLLADLVADPRPPTRLVEQLLAIDAAGDSAAAAAGVALFESLHYRLPAFSSDDLPSAASRLYARLGRADAALLLAGLALQLRPVHAPTVAAWDAVRARFDADIAAPGSDTMARAMAFAAQHEPGPGLLLALEALDDARDWPACAALFEAVWPRVRPMGEYWIYHRMSNVYASLGRNDASVLLATLAIQIAPIDRSSDQPHRRLLAYFRANGRARDAADLVMQRSTVCPEPRLLESPDLAALLAEAGPLLPSPPPAGRIDRKLIDSDVKRAQPWRSYGAGVPLCLANLQQDRTRDPISIAELHDADVLIDGGAVAVFGSDGRPHIDLSLRCFPPLLRRSLLAQADGPGAAEEIEVDAAVLISDAFPTPNLCHFLLDQATRLDLYRRAGVAVGDVMVIGPELRFGYQRETAARMGVRSYLPVSRRARLRVGRLWVSSNCHRQSHPAHWAAPWAVAAVREKFDLAPRQRTRRLLMSRRDSTYRRIGNEAALLEMLRPLGFELIVPGELSFEAQIEAFREATHVIGPHGAGMTNVLWCAPGTHVLEVFHPHYGTWAYAMLKDVLRLDYASLVGRDWESDAAEFNDTSLPRERMAPHSGRDVLVDPGELRRWLADTGLA